MTYHYTNEDHLPLDPHFFSVTPCACPPLTCLTTVASPAGKALAIEPRDVVEAAATIQARETVALIDVCNKEENIF